MSRLAILFATSEMAPWVKTGGLGDVSAALPAALRRAGHDVRVLLPYYPALQAAFPAARPLAELPALAPALPPARLLAADAAGLPLLLLDCPALFAAPGNPYLDGYGDDRHDNPLRFGLLARVAARLGQPHSPIGWQAEVVHANDWQTALAAAYLHYQGGAASVVSVHNLAFQGQFAPEVFPLLGLPPAHFRVQPARQLGLHRDHADQHQHERAEQDRHQVAEARPDRCGGSGVVELHAHAASVPAALASLPAWRGPPMRCRSSTICFCASRLRSTTSRAWAT